MFVAAILILVISIFLYTLSITQRKNYPKGPWSLPIIGNLHQIGQQPQLSLLKMSEKFGPILSVKFGSLDTVVLNDYKLMREAMAHPSIAGRLPVPLFVIRNKELKRGIFLSEVKEAIEQRKFAIRTLRELGIGKSIGGDLIKMEIEQLIQNIALQNGVPINVGEFFAPATLSSLMVVLFGKRVDHSDPVFIKNVKHIKEFFPKPNSVLGASLLMPWILKISQKFSGYDQMLFGFSSIETFIRSFIDSHIKNPIEGQPTDFIYAYLDEMKKALKNKNSSFHGQAGKENLTFSIYDLFLGGADSLKSLMAFACAALVTYPHIQEKIRLEMRSLGFSCAPSLFDRPKMPYSEAFINEVLRYNTLVPLGAMRKVTENIEFHGFKIAAGTNIIANTHAAHQDKGIWGDPSNFRPERFISEDGRIIKPDAFFPFGHGRRNCPGEVLARDTAFLFLTHLIFHFKIEPDSSNPEKPHLGFFNTVLTTQPIYSKVSFVTI